MDIAEYHIGYGHEIEKVFFDIKPVFPCWVLMVGLRSALLVVPEKEADDELRSGLEVRDNEARWVRVGVSDSMYGFERWWEGVKQCEWVKEVTIV